MPNVPTRADDDQRHIPDLSSILAAVRGARDHIAGTYTSCATAILDGDTDALEVGRRIQQSIEHLCEQLTDLANESASADRSVVEFDLTAMEYALRAREILDAVGVATGMVEHADQVINERFRPARLAADRAMYGRAIADAETKNPDDPHLPELRRHLALLEQGIEPE